jgi:hypothetical protein
MRRIANDGTLHAFKVSKRLKKRILPLLWAFFELLIFTYEDIERDPDGFLAMPCFVVFSHVIHADPSPHVDLDLHFFIAK